MTPRPIPPARVRLQAALVHGAVLACMAGGAQAQQAAPAARSSSLVTTLDTVLTYLDTDRQGALVQGTDFITEVRPGVRWSSRAGRMRGSLNYGLGLVHHSSGSPSSEAQHKLEAALTGELIERRAFVDLTASYGQQALSAYGQQSVSSNRADNANLGEVGTVSITPTLRGELGGWATYDMRLQAAATNTRKSITGDSTTTGGSVSIQSARSGAMIGWGLSASSTTTDFRATRESTSDRALATLNYTPDVDWVLTLRGGQESSDIGSNQTQSYTTWGAGLRWQPTPRTLADLSYDDRFFGSSHSVSVSHRFPRSSLRFSSARNLALSSNPNGLGQPQTLYQLFFEQFASVEPDPLRRQQLVLAFLAGQGQNPEATVGGGFIIPGASVQERQDLAWSYSALRLTLALQAFANRTGRIGDSTVQTVGEDVHQRGYNATLSYRLTPSASLGINGSRLMTRATSVQAGTDLKSLALTLTDRLGPRTTASLSARYSVFNSVTQPYRESAVTAALTMYF